MLPPSDPPAARPPCSAARRPARRSRAPSRTCLRSSCAGTAAPPPAVERAGEPRLAAPPSLRYSDTAVTAGVLERADVALTGAHDDDGLVQELVLREVERPRDLLQPARHLPGAGPQPLRLEPVEL